MNRCSIVFAFALTLTFWAFSTPTYAGAPTMCYDDYDCKVYDSDAPQCLRVFGTCEEDDDDDGGTCDFYNTYTKCKFKFDSRGDCISSIIEYVCSYKKGKARADCNHWAQDFCDCAVEEGCTDKPNGPPVDEEPL